MIAKSEHGEEPCGANRVRELSERELEVLELIGKGHLIREIAEKLCLVGSTTNSAHLSYISSRHQLLALGLEQGKQDHVTNRFCTGQQHRQSINSETKPAGWRHAVLESAQKFFVDLLRFRASLLEQTFALRVRIVQLGVTGRDLNPIDNQLVNIDNCRIDNILFRQGYKLFRAMRHE